MGSLLCILAMALGEWVGSGVAVSQVGPVQTALVIVLTVGTTGIGFLAMVLGSTLDLSLVVSGRMLASVSLLGAVAWAWTMFTAGAAASACLLALAIFLVIVGGALVGDFLTRLPRVKSFLEGHKN